MWIFANLGCRIDHSSKKKKPQFAVKSYCAWQLGLKISIDLGMDMQVQAGINQKFQIKPRYFFT